MQPEITTQKKAGAVLGVLVAIGVAVVSIAWSKGPTQVAQAPQSSNNQVAAGDASASTQNSASSSFQPASPAAGSASATQVSSRGSDDAGEGAGDDGSGEDGGGSVATNPAPARTPAPAPAQSAPATVPKRTASAYKNGTYTATGSYMSPGGQDQITVTLTLSNDVITSASVTPGAGDRTSARYQQRFISGYQQYVVGQKIQNVNLTYVSGASLTPIGFNDALAQIKQQAQA